MGHSGYIDPEKVFDAFRNCITEPKCRDCEGYGCEHFHKKVEIPATLALDTLNLLKELVVRKQKAVEATGDKMTVEEIEKRKHMCMVLFNRCAALTHCSLCDACLMRETCREERTTGRKPADPLTGPEGGAA